MIKLVLSDMDGTLLSKGASNVSYRTVRAIRALLDAGARFAPATGRQVFELDERFFGERACYQTAIAANGKRIYVDGELRHETLMTVGHCCGSSGSWPPSPMRFWLWSQR